MKMLVIDAEKREIREEENTGLESMQAVVEGLIEVAVNFPQTNKPNHIINTIYVNEEGLYKGFDYGFQIDPILYGGDNYFLGNGLVAGCDMKTGNTIATDMTIEQLKKLVSFFDVVTED